MSEIEGPVKHFAAAGYEFSMGFSDATGRSLTWQEIEEALNAHAQTESEREELALLREHWQASERMWSSGDDTGFDARTAFQELAIVAKVRAHYAAHPEADKEATADA